MFSFLTIYIKSEDCYNYDEYYDCTWTPGGGDSNKETTWNERCFQTPPKEGDKDPVYQYSYKGMHYLVGYTQLKYSSDQKSCVLSVVTRTNPREIQIGTNHILLYTFGEQEQSENSYVVTKENDGYPDGLKISVRIVKKNNPEEEIAKLDLEEEYFIWNVPKIDNDDESYNLNGQKGAIVELFGWPYEDIIEEADFLKLTGYLGVKIAPPNEHVITENWIETNGLNPWEYFIQPVSYRLTNRLGNKKDLINLINKCKKKGIRIYSQVVINQMTYQGNDIYSDHFIGCNKVAEWPGKNSTAGSPYFTIKGRKAEGRGPYTNGHTPIFEYPAVPYCGTDLICRQDANILENTYNGWVDNAIQALNTGKDYVQQRIADFFTELISIGISGLSIYKAKHIEPDNYIKIFKKFRENLGGIDLPKDFIVILEMNITYDNEYEFLICKENKNFGAYFTQELKKILFTDLEVNKIKIQSEKIFQYDNITCNNQWVIAKTRFAMSFENQDNQNNDDNNIKNKITTKEEHYTKYNSMFDKTYESQIRKVFSSYSLPDSGGNGFPDGKSDCNNLTTCVKENSGSCNCEKSVPYQKAFKRDSEGYDAGDKNSWIPNRYTRVHRRREIVNGMRQWMGLPELSIEQYRELLNQVVPEVVIKTTILTTLMTTIPKKIYSTLPTTIQTNIQTTIHNKVFTTIPKTILIQTTIPKKIYSTLPTTIIADIQTTIHNKVYTTIPKTILIQTTIPKKLYSTLPTTIITDIQTTIHNKVYTTIPKTILIQTTIPKKLYSTLPTTILTNIQTTIPKKVYTTIPKTILIQTTIPKKIYSTLPTTIITDIQTTIPKKLSTTAPTTFHKIIIPSIVKTTITIMTEPSIFEKHCLDKEKAIFHDSKNDIYYHFCPQYNKAKINENILDIVDRIDSITRYIIEAQDYFAKIAPINYLKENINTEIFLPFSYTDFTECEKILRNIYTIDSSRNITFIQVEIENTDEDIFINQLEYKAFDDTKKELNLSLCNTKDIYIHYSFKNETTDKINDIYLWKSKGIDILNINDEFFNNICYYPYSDSGKDLTIQDKIDKIYKNYTFCEKNCKVEEINFENKTSLCVCSVKEDLDIINKNFDSSKNKIERNTNFEIAKCYNSFFSIKDDIKNLGFWIFLILILLNIILIALFCCLGLKPLKSFLMEEMAKSGYIKEQDEGKAFCHNYVKKLDKLILRLNQLKKDYKQKKEEEEVEKGGAPPKHKTHIVSNIQESSRLKILKQRGSSSKDIRNKTRKFKTNIEQLKKRMGKTEKKIESTKNVKFSDKKVAVFKTSTKKSNYKLLNNTDKNKNLQGKSQLIINTENVDSKTNNFNEKKNRFELNLINMNINDLKNHFYIPNESKHILNIYTFEEAEKYEKRSFFTIYYIFLIAKQIVMHAFLYKSPIEPFPLRFSLLIFILGSDLALNDFFYTDEKISKKYNSLKSIITLAFTNNLIIIVLSILIGYLFITFFGYLNNSANEIRKIFKNEEEKISKNEKYVVTIQRKKEIILEIQKIINRFKIKLIVFYVFEFLFLFFYWYYATVFCHIYKNTQISWIFDSFVTIIIRVIFDFLINILFSFIYIQSIRCKCNCLFRVIIFIYCLA